MRVNQSVSTRHYSYTPFVVYRLALGILLLVLIYGFGWAPGVSAA